MRKNIVFGALAVAICCAAMTASGAEEGVSGLIGALKSGDEAARVEALEKLAALEGGGAAAVPALRACLKDDSATVRALAAECLGEIGEAARVAVEDMVPLIGDQDARVRREVIEAVRSIRPGPRVVLPLLLKVIQDDDPAVRIRALHAMTDHGSEAVEALSEALGDKETAYWACLVLAEIGPDAAAAVPALIDHLGSKEDYHLRREAMMALAAIGEASAPAVPHLVEALDDEVNNAPATYALGMIGKLTPEAVEKMEANVKSDDKVLATVSAWALARTHPDDKRRARRAARLLIARLMSGDAKARSMAAQGLFDLDIDPEITRPLWEKALEGADEAVVVAALDSMASMGAPVVPRLIAALENEKTRGHVAYILGKIGPDAAPAVDALAEYAGSDDDEVQHEVLFALGKIGPAAKSAVPALVKVLQEDEGAGRYGACYALGQIGPDAMPAKEALLSAVGGDDESLRLFSAWALARIHPECPTTCKTTVPLLVQGLEDPDPQFRLGATEALCCLGKLAKAAVPGLKKALDDEDPHVREAAAEALEAIGE